MAVRGLLSGRGEKEDQSLTVRALCVQWVDQGRRKPLKAREREIKNQRLEFRASERQRYLLAAASEAEGVNLSDFVLSHAIHAAENVLADRRVFYLAPERFDALTRDLDRREREVPSLRKLFEAPSILEEA